jgi:hypothetical protein
MTPDPELRQSYESTLTNAGVPVNLARQCSEIVAKDDASLPNLGRTENDQHLIDSSMEWMKAKGFFKR